MSRTRNVGKCGNISLPSHPDMLMGVEIQKRESTTTQDACTFRVSKDLKKHTLKCGDNDSYCQRHCRSTGVMLSIVSGSIQCFCHFVLNMTSGFFSMSLEWADRLQFTETETQTINTCIIKRVGSSFSLNWKTVEQHWKKGVSALEGNSNDAKCVSHILPYVHINTHRHLWRYTLLGGSTVKSSPRGQIQTQ